MHSLYIVRPCTAPEDTKTFLERISATSSTAFNMITDWLNDQRDDDGNLCDEGDIVELVTKLKALENK
jgi:hypothetical protein